MINRLAEVELSIRATLIEWEPRDWSDRKAWGRGIEDGFYITKSGELYRLSGNTVVYVTQEDIQ